MSQDNKICQICGELGHSKFYCKNKPIKPIIRKVTKQPIKHTSIKKTVKTKKPNRSKLKKDLDKLVKDSVKIRDNFTCQHCHKKVTGTNCHGSHILPVGSHSNMQFDPRNIKVLCFHCHRHFWHNNPLEAGEWYRRMFPTNWAYLEAQSKVAPKIMTYELQMMIEDYKRLLNK